MGVLIGEDPNSLSYAIKLNMPTGSTSVSGSMATIDFDDAAAGWTYTNPNTVGLTDPNDILDIGDNS